jgi:hypothetical protein
LVFSTFRFAKLKYFVEYIKELEIIGLGLESVFIGMNTFFVSEYA